MIIGTPFLASQGWSILRTDSAMPQTADSPPCRVCGLTVARHMEASCSTCGALYHLNQRVDLPGDDCGLVWINEDHLGLEFACNICLNPAPVDLDDVLDAAEAAATAGITQEDVERAASLGKLRHRRTAGGVLLFRRGDVIEFAGEGL